VEPAGALGPNTDPLAGPLTVTPTLDSSNTALVGLKNTTIDGQPEQLLGFAFSNGLPAGSVLRASIFYNTSQPPQLVPYQTTGISALSSSSGSTNTTSGSQTSGADGSNGGGGTPNGQAPEPLSLLIWATLAGGVLARAQFLRQSKSGG
jgi:hypothetical protein